jgi:hypothetical protein
MSNRLLKIESVDWRTGTVKFNRPAADGEHGQVVYEKDIDTKLRTVTVHVTLSDGRKYRHSVKESIKDLLKPPTPGQLRGRKWPFLPDVKKDDWPHKPSCLKCKHHFVNVEDEPCNTCLNSLSRPKWEPR